MNCSYCQIKLTKISKKETCICGLHICQTCFTKTSMVPMPREDFEFRFKEMFKGEHNITTCKGLGDTLNISEVNLFSGQCI